MEKGTYKVKISGVIFRMMPLFMYIYQSQLTESMRIGQPFSAQVLARIIIYNINSFVIIIRKEHGFMFKRYVTAQ